MSATLNDPVRLTDDDSAIASTAARALARVEMQDGPIELRIGAGADAQVVVLPSEVVRLFVRTLAEPGASFARVLQARIDQQQAA